MRATTLLDAERLAGHPGREMLELSPLETAAKASASLDAGLAQHLPVEADAGHGRAGEVGAEPAERARVLVDDGDGVAAVSRLWARVEPTRPQPMITMCTLADASDRRPALGDASPRSRHARRRAWHGD